MFKVLFVCHGNICRSPMAEYVLRDYVNKLGIKDNFIIDSAATSQEEIGNSVYPPVKKLLTSLNIDCHLKRARQINLGDTKSFDYIIAMEQYNLDNLYQLFPKIDKSKVYLLKDFTKEPGDIEDPWYTRDFEKAYREIASSCLELIDSLYQDYLLELTPQQASKLKALKQFN